MTKKIKIVLHIRIYFLIITCLLIFINTIPATADQYGFIPLKIVSKLNKIIKINQKIRFYCPPCGDITYKERIIKTIQFKKIDHNNNYSIIINNDQVDIAYLYIKKNGYWKNLALECGLQVHSIVPYLNSKNRLPVPKYYFKQKCNYLIQLKKGKNAEKKKLYSQALHHYTLAQKCDNTIHTTNYSLAAICEKLHLWEKAGDAWYANIKYWPFDKYAAARAAFAYCKAKTPSAKNKSLNAIKYTLSIISGTSNKKKLYHASNSIYKSLQNNYQFSNLVNHIYKSAIIISDGILYKIKLHDTLSKIAKKHAIPKWQTIYYHKKNNLFRKKHPNPSLIYPEDLLFIPLNKKAISETLQKTQYQNHNNKKPHFKLKTEKIIFHFKIPGHRIIYKFKLKTEHEQIVRYFKTKNLSIKKRLLHGTIQEEINPTNSYARLEVWTTRNITKRPKLYSIQIGHLPPINTLYGVQVRLSSLGYQCKMDMGAYKQATKKAIKSFQEKHNIIDDGWAGPQTSYFINKAYMQD